MGRWEAAGLVGVLASRLSAGCCLQSEQRLLLNRWLRLEGLVVEGAVAAAAAAAVHSAPGVKPKCQVSATEERQAHCSDDSMDLVQNNTELLEPVRIQ